MKDGYRDNIIKRFLDSSIFYEFLNDHISLYRKSEATSENSNKSDGNDFTGTNIFNQIVYYYPLTF